MEILAPRRRGPKIIFEDAKKWKDITVHSNVEVSARMTKHYPERDS
jgi:hypothetical protein